VCRNISQSSHLGREGEMTDKNTEKSINELEKLFLLDLLPETIEEAQEILADAEIDTTELKEKGREIFRNILAEFDDDWRNISKEVLKSETSEILKRQFRTDLSRESLLDKIRGATQALTARGLSTTLSAGVAHRNLDKVSDLDLAYLLRQLEYIAEQAGIDLGEE